MKVAKITNTFWTFLILTMLGMFTSCVQGPVNTTTQESQVFPTLTSSTPVASAISVTTADVDPTFQVQVLDQTSENYRLRWYLNSFIQNSSNDQTTFIFPINSANTGIGAHTLTVKLYNNDGSVILGERVWYITVSTSTGITAYSTSPSTKIDVNDQTTGEYTGIGLKVVGSEVNGIKTMHVEYYYKADTAPATVPVLIPLLANNDLADDTFLTLDQYNNTFATALSNTTPFEQQIIARVYQYKDQFGNLLPSKIQVNSDVTWTINVIPANYKPVVTFAGGATGTQLTTATQETDKVFTIDVSDVDHTVATQVRVAFEIKRAADPTYTRLDGNPASVIPGTNYAPNCTGTGITSCTINFPSYSATGTVPGQDYNIRVVAEDYGVDNNIFTAGDNLTSDMIYWTVSVAEEKAGIPVITSSVVAVPTIDETARQRIDITIQDNQRDKFCLKIIRQSTPTLTVSDTCPTDPKTEAIPFGNFGSNTHIENNDGNVGFNVREDAISTLTGTVNYTIELFEVRDDGSYSATVYDNVSFTVNSYNDNEPMGLTLRAETPALASTNTVMTGVPFTIVPGDFSDDSTPIYGNNKLYYQWQVTTGVGNCTLGGWTDIPGEGNWNGTPIDYTTGAFDATLVWTPPPSAAGKKVCFRLKYKDDGPEGEIASATQPMVWGTTNDFITVVDNTLSQVVPMSAHNVMAVATDTAGKATYTARSNGSGDIILEKRTFSGTGVSDPLAPLLGTINTGADSIEKLSIALDGAGNLIVAALKNISTNLSIEVFKFAVTDLTTETAASLSIPSNARDMGSIIFDGSSNFFIPYIRSNDSKIYIAHEGVAAFASLTEDLMTALSDGHAELTNTSNFIPGIGEYRMIIAARSINAVTGDWTMSSFKINGGVVEAVPVELNANVYSSSNIEDVQLVVVDQMVYAAGINTGTSNTVAMISMEEDDFLLTNLVSSIPTVNSVGTTISPTETTNLKSIRLRARPSTKIGHSSLIMAVQNGLNNIHLLDLDVSVGAWTFKDSGNSYLLNNYLLPSSNDQFYISEILEDMNGGDAGSTTDENLKDSLIVFYETAGTGTEILQVNTEREEIAVTSESASSWHPGFFKVATPSTDPSFISVWTTTAAAETITLPLVNGYTYNFTVNWGDGSAADTITTWNQAEATHSYAAAGTYTVTITGTAEAWSFNNGGSKSKIIRVASFGDTTWTNLDGAFYGANNLISFAGGVTTSATSMAQMFKDTTSLTHLDVSSFNTQLTTDMSEMFAGASALTSLDVSNFNTIAVTNMAQMFMGASTLTALDLSNFDTASVTSMDSMFNGTTKIAAIDLTSFDTSDVTSMSSMFANTTNLPALDLTSFSTYSVTNMSGMFENATALAALDITSFNTSAVTNMSTMFKGASNLTSFDLSFFDTTAVTNMTEMFEDATGLTSLNLNNWDVTTAPPVSTEIFNNMTATILCDQDPGAGKGTIFGETCN